MKNTTRLSEWRGLFAVFAFVSLASAQELTFTPFHANGIYRLGEAVGWTVTLVPSAAPVEGSYTYSVRKNNFDLVGSGRLDFTSGSASVETVLNEPGMLYVEVNGAGRRIAALCAAVAPESLKPSAPRPADFDAFWGAKLKALSETAIIRC